MISPDGREDSTPIVTDLFPLEPASCSSAIRDIINYDKVLGERSILAIDNELLLLYLEGRGAHYYGDYGDYSFLGPFYQRGIYLSHRALRAEAFFRGGRLTTFDPELLAEYKKSFVDPTKENHLASCYKFYLLKLGLPPEEAINKLLNDRPETIKEVNKAYETHFEASQEAFEKYERPFHQAITANIRNLTDMERNAILAGASLAWAPFKFLSQRAA